MLLLNCYCVTNTAVIFLYGILLLLSLYKHLKCSRRWMKVCLLTSDFVLRLGYCCSYSGSGRSSTKSQICTVAGTDSVVR